MTFQPTKFLLTAILALAVAAPLSAAGFRADNRVMVSGSANSISVPNGGGYGARGMWCAAADYALSVLNARDVDRLYVAQASANGQGGPVTFTLDGAGLNPTPVTITGASLRTAGSNLSVGHAHGFCADSRLVNR